MGKYKIIGNDDIKVSTRIPSEAEVGDHVEMECRWDIYGGKSLYSVKWYKDGHEFFRYVPDNVQPLQTFNQPGVKLDTEMHIIEAFGTEQVRQDN
ncbi:hypothetical protein PV327_002802 [Microctonus hyperodae]|uniref:Ig-like domain-containing protein n=1 Tax=Microctonus hyperodae TaxID=165561 RepID=A0AA39FGG5_MICHY|nr:hypothetical protein PV327_002802 [Microctonus hyperodae]